MLVTLRVAVLFLFIVFIASCGKDNNTVTGGHVDAYIYLNDPSSIQLNAIGGWIYYSSSGNSGLKGLIIFRRSQDEFSAYDRACTYHTNESCALVEVESNNTFGIDSCCGSRFNLYSLGIVEKGPATQPLIQYHTTFDGSILHVSSF
ncbi:MAG: hypothetical protein ACHQNT_02830 [Bacteroidia bacterium]